MPLIKGGPPVRDIEAASSARDSNHEISDLTSADSAVRWRAARALGGNPVAVAPLAEALSKEGTPLVREAILTALMRVGDENSIEVLLPYLRSQDAGMRNAAIETLQALPDAVIPFMTSLLTDKDSDVRLLATELARNMPADRATKLLTGLLDRESHPNVCAAAIEVLAELGTMEALPSLRSCVDRFAGTPFLPFAASQAIARISEGQG
jgi:HEAT repeat protein